MGKEPDQILLQRGHTDGQQTYEKMLNVINHEKNANYSHIRHHLTPVRMAIINKSTNNKCWRRCGERREPFCTVGGNADWCSHCGKQYGDTSKKLKMELPYDPGILILGIYPKKLKALIQKEHKHPCVHCSVIYNCQDMETAQGPIANEAIK